MLKINKILQSFLHALYRMNIFLTFLTVIIVILKFINYHFMVKIIISVVEIITNLKNFIRDFSKKDFLVTIILLKYIPL